MKKLTFLKLALYAFTEFSLSAGMFKCFESGSALGWFILGAFLVLFNAAILSVEADKSNVIMYKGN